MKGPFASDFAEIPSTLQKNDLIRERALQLAGADPIPGKVTEGDARLEAFRVVLSDLIAGNVTLTEAMHRVAQQLPRDESIHAGNNRVFPQGWEERLVRTQFSRFYNQAILELLREEGQARCFVPHSRAEDRDSPCSVGLAGREHDVETLYARLTETYRDGQWNQELKIPNHPHCTHVITPAQ